jgi:hypothetical protein
MKTLLIIFLYIAFLITDSTAYVGLGPLIPIIGSSIIFLWGLIVVLIGFFSYPLIKLYKFIKSKKKKNLELKSNNAQDK